MNDCLVAVELVWVIKVILLCLYKVNQTADTLTVINSVRTDHGVLK